MNSSNRYLKFIGPVEKKNLLQICLFGFSIFFNLLISYALWNFDSVVYTWHAEALNLICDNLRIKRKYGSCWRLVLLYQLPCVCFCCTTKITSLFETQQV